MHHFLLIGLAALMALAVVVTRIALLFRDHGRAARRRRRRRENLGRQWAWDRFFRPIRYKQLTSKVKASEIEPMPPPPARKPVNIARAWAGDIAGRRRRR